MSALGHLSIRLFLVISCVYMFSFQQGRAHPDGDYAIDVLERIKIVVTPGAQHGASPSEIQSSCSAYESLYGELDHKFPSEMTETRMCHPCCPAQLALSDPKYASCHTQTGLKLLLLTVEEAIFTLRASKSFHRSIELWYDWYGS